MTVKLNHYRTMQDPTTGRWLVVHDVPGLSTPAVDCDCLTQGGAALEAAWMESARNAALRQQADERALVGLRAGAAQ